MNDSLDTRISGISSALLLVAGLMVAAGLAWPSASAGADPQPGFHSLGGPARPVRLEVPALRVRAPITPIEVDDRAVLDPPRNPSDVGWWRRSAKPGASAGQTVITGHTVHTGGGAMDRLGRLRRGKVVRVVTPRGALVYRTTRVVTWSKSQLAEHAEDIFSQGRQRNRLVLITCTDWNGSSYDSNVLVFARPLGVRDHAA